MKYEYVGKEALKAFWDKVLGVIDFKMAAAGATGITFDQVYPIGSVILSVDNVNPGLKFRNTTWERIADGRCLVGVGTGTDKNGVSQTFIENENAYGEYTHPLNVDELPSHTHEMSHTHTTDEPSTSTFTTSSSGKHGHSSKYGKDVSGSGGKDLAYSAGGYTQSSLIVEGGAHTHTVSINHTHNTNSQSVTTTSSVGSGNAINIVQPSFGVYIWKRVA